MSEEATINADGTQDMNMPTPAPVPVPDTENGPSPFNQEIPVMDKDTMEEVAKGIDPAIYLLIVAFIVAAVLIYLNLRKKNNGGDDFFAELDGDKVGPSYESLALKKVLGYVACAKRGSNCHLANTPFPSLTHSLPSLSLISSYLTK